MCICRCANIIVSTHRTCSLICLIFALGVCRLKYWDDVLCHIHRNHRGSVSPYVLYPNQQVWNCEWPLHHQTRHSTDVLFVLLPTVTKLYSYSCPTKKQLQPFIHSKLVNQIQRQQISRTRTKHCQYFFVNLSSLTHGNVIQLAPGITVPSTNHRFNWNPAAEDSCRRSSWWPSWSRRPPPCFPQWDDWKWLEHLWERQP